MFLGNFEGFENKTSIHISDTFQRAVLNDCLFTLVNHYNLDAKVFFDSELNYLIKRRNNDSIGAWSYFPTVKEIAADIDDLAQIMQLFIINKKSYFIEQYCQKAINISLNESMNSNGGIETWIVPKNHQTPLQKKQEIFNLNKWGKGPDTEVMANFIYALYIFDKKKFEKYIEKATSYIISNQNENGYWESRWYYGVYYGTYICLKLLRNFKKKYKNQIKKSLLYLINKQNSDGGFSLENEKSDPLSTSLAVLSLKLFYPTSNNAVKLGIKYLRNSQNKDGSWSEVNFIKPKTSDPYKSKTITTAYALKSLCFHE
jgi:hypothetical protein